MPLYANKIVIAARDSQLSIAQVEEVKKLLLKHYPELIFEEVFVKTYGDKDLKTSLRRMEKTDFFTKEVDDLVLNKRCDVAVHSAKDLPEKIPEGLTIAALTEGVDPFDSLVFRANESLPSLKEGAIIGVSCERREKAVKLLREDFECVDIRGPVDRRVELLFQGKYDAVVIAEAALIRLGLTHLNRIPLKAETSPLQGKLALLACKEDSAIQSILSVLHYENSMSWS